MKQKEEKSKFLVQIEANLSWLGKGGAGYNQTNQTGTTSQFSSTNLSCKGGCESTFSYQDPTLWKNSLSDPMRWKITNVTKIIHIEEFLCEELIKSFEFPTSLKKKVSEKIFGTTELEIDPLMLQFNFEEGCYYTSLLSQLTKRAKVPFQLEKTPELESIWTISRTELKIHASKDEEYKNFPCNEDKLLHPSYCLEQSEIPRVCLIGDEGVGKTTLSNVICGEELFSRSFTRIGRVQQILTKWEGKGNSIYIVDFDKYSGVSDEIHIKELAELKGFSDINLFILVLDSKSRIDRYAQEMLKVFKQILGEKVFEHVCVVFTRWDYDARSLRYRKKFNITEEEREREVKQYLKDKIQINTDKYPIKCFFIDSISFVHTENDDDEKALARLREEFDKLK